MSEMSELMEIFLKKVKSKMDGTYIDDGSERNCGCCERQFCDRDYFEDENNIEVPEEWKKCIENYECPRCGVNEDGVFWLRQDGIECIQCR